MGKKAATEGSPFGPDNIVFKVKAKMFALLALDEVPPRFLEFVIGSWWMLGIAMQVGAGLIGRLRPAPGRVR